MVGADFEDQTVTLRALGKSPPVVVNGNYVVMPQTDYQNLKAGTYDQLLEALEAVDLARMSDAPNDWERATNLTDAALRKARGEAWR